MLISSLNFKIIFNSNKYNMTLNGATEAQKMNFLKMLDHLVFLLQSQLRTFGIGDFQLRYN